MGSSVSKYERDAFGSAKDLKKASMKALREKYPHAEQVLLYCGEEDLPFIQEAVAALGGVTTQPNGLPLWLRAHMLGTDDSLLEDFCKQCKTLAAPNVRFDGLSTPTFQALEALAGPHLKQLAMESTNARGMAGALNVVFAQSPNITTLHLNMAGYDAKDVVAAVEAIFQFLLKLEVLNLDDVNQAADENLARAIKNVIAEANAAKRSAPAKLRSLTLGGRSIGDETIAAIMSDTNGVIFAPKTTLAHVDLASAGGKLTMAQYRAFLTTFLQPATTTGLGLPFSLRGSVSGDNAIYKILAAYKQLAFLNIAQLDLPAADVIALIKNTLNPAVLQKLDISFNGALDNTVLAALAQDPRPYPRLADFSANQTAMTDAKLAKALVDKVDATLRRAQFAKLDNGKERDALTETSRIFADLC